ncbi:hypothetical protein [Aeromicrobium yanjiei]|uniref:Uncharacterized protein n=1 Tax=Aeromicrobium yanjiei TaxID=2662028 RepID=A0A5Q2MBX8_9ACTN|nr:hypothetical protein [Aeromicrobium yanjiei]QGG40068.1 hypothetical protein GEV26_00990 [Aeromicrobium yanjiei]
MPRPFKKTAPTTFRDKLESQLSDLADQTDELRKVVVARAPEVRDQLVEQAGELRQQVVERAPGVRDQIVAAIPDKDQLLDLRDDLFERLPENVQEKLPERSKPKKTRLRKVAALGVLTGAGAAAFAILKRRGQPDHAYTPPTSTPPPAAPTTPPPPSSSTAPTAADLTGDGTDGTAGKS